MSLWEVSSGQPVYRLDQYTAVTKVLFSPDGVLALAGTMDGDIVLFEVASGHSLGYFRGHARIVHDMAFHADGQSFWSAAGDDTVREWRVETSQVALHDWVATQRYIPELTPEQCERYGLTRLA